MKRLTSVGRLFLRLLMLGFVFIVGTQSFAQTAQAAVPEVSTQAIVRTVPAAVPTLVGSSLRATVVQAAESQLGVNQDCTTLVTNALAAAGINYHDWPAGYKSLGTQVSAAQALPGDLLYYADGGTGWAHIAVYIGNGQAVHGGFNGTTTIWNVNVGYGIPPTAYIRLYGAENISVPPPDPGPVFQPAAAVSSSVHIVAPGETLSSIAASVGLGDWHSLLNANPDIGNPNLIYVGQALNVPISG